MIDILLQGIDDETRLRLLPKEQEIIKSWEAEGTLLASYIKRSWLVGVRCVAFTIGGS